MIDIEKIWERVQRDLKRCADEERLPSQSLLDREYLVIEHARLKEKIDSLKLELVTSKHNQASAADRVQALEKALEPLLRLHSMHLYWIGGEDNWKRERELREFSLTVTKAELDAAALAKDGGPDAS